MMQNHRDRFNIKWLMITCSLMALTACHDEPPNLKPDGFWVWAGIPMSAVPAAASDLYVYQGQFTQTGGFISRGPQSGVPTPPSTSVRLVYRMHHLVEQGNLLAVHEFFAKRWEKHGVKVVGLQLDFDSPSAKLSTYADYLQKLRAALPQQTELSITGLASWLVDNPSAQQAIQQNVDFVAYQFYVGREPLVQIDAYIGMLKETRQPYYIGVLKDQDRVVIEQQLNRKAAASGFQGYIVFIQK